MQYVTLHSQYKNKGTSGYVKTLLGDVLFFYFF